MSHRKSALLLVLLMVFDFTVGAIFGQKAFGAVCPLTTIGWALTVMIFREKKQ
jgi:hypothetical protein